MAAAPAASIFVILSSAIFIFIFCAAADPSDESCLSSLYASLSDPAGRLRNWTRPNLGRPCNGFTSYIAGATCNNGRIYKLTLTGLGLGGSLPSAGLGNCTNLQTLDLSSNSLVGPIPTQLSLLLNLAVLNLSSNLLSGQIPPQLALCAYLNVIDLHSNRLTGQIPDQLGLLVRLSAFDVSYNRLQGPIPFLLANRSLTNGGLGGGGGGGPRFNVSSFVGNDGLYGFPLSPMRGKSLSVTAIVGIGLGSGLLSLVISFTAVCIWLRLTDRTAAVNGEQAKISHLMPDY